MTKISIYKVDEKVIGNDKWIGSDAQNQYATKNFTPNKLSEYFNENQVIDIGIPIRYRYDILEVGDSRLPGTITFNPQVGTPYDFSNITSFLISKYTLKGNDITKYLDFIVGTNILLYRSNNVNIYGYFSVVSIEEYLPEPNFFIMTLNYISGDGYMEEDRDYLISLIDVYGPSVIPSLDNVLGAGNTSDKSIVLNHVPNIDPIPWINTIDGKELTIEWSPSIGDEYYYASYRGNSISLSANEEGIDKLTEINLDYLKINSGNYYSIIQPSNIILGNSTGNGQIRVSNLTNNIVLQFPNKSTGTYTIATLDDISTGVTSVTATSPITSTGGSTPDISTLMSTNKLIGRGSVGSGEMEEITLGTGLSFTGTTLNATANVTPAALTKTDDTNVTLTLGGSPSTALLQATSLTLGWTGTLADSRISSASTWNAKQNTISLTNTGTGAATFISDVLNIPTYTSPLTTKGDIFVRNSSVDTRLGVGVDGQILIADSTKPTGIKWGAQNTPSPSGYYGAFQDVLTQTITTINVGQPFLIRTTDESNQVSITQNGSGQYTRITPANTGVYNIQWSGQFQNTDNAIHDINVWFRKGLVSSSGPGTDITGSNGVVALPARKNNLPTDYGHVVAGWNFVLTIAAGEYIEFYWMSDSTQVTLQAYSAGSPPPSTASLIVTVTQQAGIMAGTGITAINSLTGASQTLTTGTSGTDFNIVDSGVDHKFNLPTASATNRGALSSSDWTTFNNKQNALGYTPIKSIIKDTVTYPTLTGTTLETLSATYLIPANTFAASDMMKITSFLAEKTGIIGTCTMRIKIGPSSTWTSGSNTVLATYTTGITELWCIMQRQGITIKGGNLKYLQGTIARQTDIIATAAVITTFAFNPAVDNYIFTSLQLSVSTDSVFQSNFIITN